MTSVRDKLHCASGKRSRQDPEEREIHMLGNGKAACSWRMENTVMEWGPHSPLKSAMLASCAYAWILLPMDLLAFLCPLIVAIEGSGGHHYPSTA